MLPQGTHSTGSSTTRGCWRKLILWAQEAFAFSSAPASPQQEFTAETPDPARYTVWSRMIWQASAKLMLLPCPRTRRMMRKKRAAIAFLGIVDAFVEPDPDFSSAQ